jgi:hypothetical protein
MTTNVKIFHYLNGSVRVTTDTQIAYFTIDEWAVIERYCSSELEDDLAIDESDQGQNWD